MTIRRLTFEDFFKPNYHKKSKRRAKRRRGSQASRYRTEENRKRNWDRIRKASLQEFGE